MRTEWSRSVLISLVYILFVRVSSSGIKYYTNEWIVHVPLGHVAANVVAQSNDMKYEGPDRHNDGFYYMTKSELLPKSSEPNEEITNKLNNHDLVTIATQKAVKERSYRGVAQPRHVVPRTHQQSHYENTFNDKRWPDMWYFQDYRTSNEEPVVDMNLVPVHKELQITGHNVNITVADDGIEWTHPEIFPKYNKNLSWNYISDNNNIMPDKNNQGSYNTHGTRCAGEIIMQPNNGLCGVGVAYDASIGGVKFLDGKSTDDREANVLSYAFQYVSIYSNSWGPSDSGTFMEHLSMLVKRSLSKGIHQGRDGKGIIYVFAGGNGKVVGDNCACDGYVNSIYTISVASCDDSGHVTEYSERCPSIITTAYSGSGREKNILTTDVNGRCTDQHTGTSAAAPLVSGIIALALSANPKLTWRDVKHLITWTSQIAPLSDNFGWIMNKAGFYYSLDFGFGLMNAYQFVLAAMNWENVPKMSSCGIRLPKVKDIPITRNKAARIIVNSNGCNGLSGEINYIEHVQLVLTMSYSKRGDIQIIMKSPAGTQCQVLENRPLDNDKNGLNRWTFSIIAFWGEHPKGQFIIDIFDTTGSSFNKGIISEMTLSIHGTKDPPKHYLNGYRSYDKFNLVKPGDKAIFRHLSFHGESLDESEVNEESYTHNENSRQIQNDNAFNYQTNKNNVLNNKIEKVLTNMEIDAQNQKDAILLNANPMSWLH